MIIDVVTSSTGTMAFDAHLVAGTSVITTNTIDFSHRDIGKRITGRGIPADTRITEIHVALNQGSTLTLSAAATSTRDAPLVVYSGAQPLWGCGIWYFQVFHSIEPVGKSGAYTATADRDFWCYSPCYPQKVVGTSRFGPRTKQQSPPTTLRKLFP